MLEGLGATVDRVEDLEGSDPLRQHPVHAVINAGKRSACIDLKKPEGRDAFLRLVTRYDVVIDPFRPNVLARLGLSHGTLLERNPRLVVCALTGYGQTGPLALRAGHDVNYLARAGVLGLQGPAGGVPQLPGFQLADIGGALWAVIGVLSALLEREATGRGKIVDVSMTEAAAPFAILAQTLALQGASVVRGDEPLSGALAAYGIYETLDGKFMTLGALEPKFWATFAAAVGLPPDATAVTPGDHQRRLKERVREVFRSRTRAEWEAFAQEHDCCLEPVLEAGELTEPPKAGRLPVSTRSGLPREAARAGEHTDAILTDAGFTLAEVQSLRDADVVR